MRLQILHHETGETVADTVSRVKPSVGDWITICDDGEDPLNNAWMITTVLIPIVKSIPETGNVVMAYAKPIDLKMPELKRKLFKIVRDR